MKNNEILSVQQEKSMIVNICMTDSFHVLL